MRRDIGTHSTVLPVDGGDRRRLSNDLRLVDLFIGVEVVLQREKD